MTFELIAPDGTALELMPGTVVQLNLKNPVFNINELEGSYSFAFNLPLSDRNRLYFGFPDKVSSLAGYNVEYPGFRLKSGLIEFNCKLILRKVVGSALSVNLYTASAAQADLLRETLMTEIETQTINISEEFWYGKYRFTADPGTVGEVASATVLWQISGGGTATYQYGAKYTGSITDLMKDFARKINTTTLIPTYAAGTTYALDELVLNAAGTEVYRSADDGNLGNLLTDGAWWEFLCLKSEWNEKRQLNSTPLWYMYDEFDYTKREKAFAVDDYLVIYDPLKGVGRYLDVNSTNQTADVTAAGYFTPYEYAAYGINVWQDNFTAIATWMTALVLNALANPDFTFFPIHNPDFSPNPDFCGVVNYWREGAFRGNEPRVGPFQHAFSAQVNLVYALRKMFEYLEIEVEDEDVLSDSFIQTLYAFNNFSNDRHIRGFDAAGYFAVDSGVNLLNVSQNLPPISLAEFINGFRGYFFCGVWFDWFTKRVHIQSLKSLLTDYSNAVDLTSIVANFQELEYVNPDGFSLQFTHDGNDGFIGENLLDIYEDGFNRLDPVANFAALPTAEENDLCLVKDEDAWYLGVLVYEGIVEWQYFSKNLYGLEIGEAKTNYQPRCATPLMYQGHDFARGPKAPIVQFVKSPDTTYREGEFVKEEDGDFFEAIEENSDVALTDGSKWAARTLYQWQIPMTSQARRSRNFKEKTPCSLRLVSYQGIAQNPLSSDPEDTFPLATNDAGEDGSLKWDGEHGLYEKYGKEWIAFLSKAKTAMASFPINENLLQALKPWRLVKIGNQFYVQGNLKVSFPLDSSLAEITLYSINVAS
jgi:hypothetical protein